MELEEIKKVKELAEEAIAEILTEVKVKTDCIIIGLKIDDVVVGQINGDDEQLINSVTIELKI